MSNNDDNARKNLPSGIFNNTTTINSEILLSE